MMPGRKHFSARRWVFCALFSALLIAGAYIKIPMPLVPMTLQAQFALLAGVLLGAVDGSLSVLVYILLGLCGLPVFTGGGGIGYVLYPTFGYIIGFAAGACAAGVIVQKSSAPTFWRILCAQLVGLGLIYLLGVLYFGLIKTVVLHEQITLSKLIYSCFLLTLPNDLLLCTVGSLAAKRLLSVWKRMR